MPERQRLRGGVLRPADVVELVVSTGAEISREHIPTSAASTELSNVATLRRPPEPFAEGPRNRRYEGYLASAGLNVTATYRFPSP